jgi:hypothetical protein
MMLMHQLRLALHHKSLVHPLEVLKVLGLQIIGQPNIQSIQKIILLLLISVNFMRSIERLLSELENILIHRYGPLFQILKFLLHQLDNSLENMMCTKCSSKFWPVDAVGLHVSIPPVSCSTKKLVRG